MSPKFALVKNYYDMGAWNIERVRLAVEKSWITKEEFLEITGERYDG